MLLSCSSDDNNDNNNVSVEGTWELTKFELTEEVDLDNDGTASADIMGQTECFNNSTLVFDADNTADFNIESLDVEIQPVEGGAEGEGVAVAHVGRHRSDRGAGLAQSVGRARRSAIGRTTGRSQLRQARCG